MKKQCEAWWYQAATITVWLCSTVTASEGLSCVLFLSVRGILISLAGWSNHAVDPHLGRHALPEAHPSALRSITRKTFHLFPA